MSTLQEINTETIELNSIQKVQLTDSNLILHVEEAVTCRIEPKAYSLVHGGLRIRGGKTNGTLKIEITTGGGSLPEPFHHHYIPISTAYRFGGVHFGTFTPCTYPNHKDTFGLAFDGIGISDIEDIDIQGQARRSSNDCHQKQLAMDVFKLFDGDPNGGTSCEIELHLSDKFPGALQVKFQPLAKGSSEAPRVFLYVRQLK
ncbi:MAG: hypothetical protein AAF570_08395 [Bacteroidota bacterium]